MMVHAASDLRGNRLVLAHRGGYAETYVLFCGLAIVEGLARRCTEVCDRSWNWCKISLTRGCSRIRRLRFERANELLSRIRWTRNRRHICKQRATRTLRASKTAMVGASQMLFYR